MGKPIKMLRGLADTKWCDSVVWQKANFFSTHSSFLVRQWQSGILRQKSGSSCCTLGVQNLSQFASYFSITALVLCGQKDFWVLYPSQQLLTSGTLRSCYLPGHWSLDSNSDRRCLRLLPFCSCVWLHITDALRAAKLLTQWTEVFVKVAIALAFQLLLTASSCGCKV